MYVLGLHKDDLPWNFIVERSNTIQAVFDSDRAKARCKIQHIIESIQKNLISSTEVANEQSKVLASIPFLPVQQKPVGYPLPWCSDGHVLSSVKELIMPGTRDKYIDVYRNELLCGSQIKILNTHGSTGSDSFELKIPDKVQDFHQIRGDPSCADVIVQF